MGREVIKYHVKVAAAVLRDDLVHELDEFLGPVPGVARTGHLPGLGGEGAEQVYRPVPYLIVCSLFGFPE